MSKPKMLEFFRRFPLVLFILGGADLAPLEKAPSDRGEFRARGFAAIVPAVLAVAGFTVGVDIAIGNLPVAFLVGLVWGFIVLLMDVSLLTSLVDAGWVRRTLMIIIRGTISAAASLAVSSFILLAIFSQDIGPQVVADQTRAAQSYYQNVVVPQYAAERTAAQATLDKDQAALNKANQAVAALTNTVANDKHKVACEANGVSGANGCEKTSGSAGLGQNYRVDVDKLNIDQGKLTDAQTQAEALQKRLAPEMAAAQATLDKTSQGTATDKQAALSRSLADQGLIPQWKALAELRAQSPSVDFWAWVIEILLVAVDLMAVIAAVFSRTPAYRRVLEGMLAKSSAEAAIQEAEAQSALMRRETEIRIDTAPQARAAAQADAEVSELEDRHTLAALRRSREIAAERATSSKLAAIEAAETEAQIAEIKARTALAAAQAKVEIARVEHDEMEVKLGLARMDWELQNLGAGQPDTTMP